MIILSKSSVEINDIINFLKENLKYKDTYHRILSQKIIVHTAQEKGVTITEKEIQEEADRFRRHKRLEKAEDTFAWLEEQMISANAWENGIYNRLLSQKLAKTLFDSEVDKYFAEHRLDFEQIILYQIVVPYQKLAQELFYQIEEEEISFYEAAHLYDIDEQRRYRCGYEGLVPRWTLKPDFAAAIFSGSVGEMVGPIKTEQGYHLVLINEFIPAELTAERREEIINKLFQEWLAKELNYLFHNQS